MGKKFLCCVLAGLIAMFGGCGRRGNELDNRPEAAAAGRYVETKITPPDLSGASSTETVASLGVFPRQDGTLDYMALVAPKGTPQEERLAHYRSRDRGDTWERMETAWYDTMLQTYGGNAAAQVRFATMDESGAIYCIVKLEDYNRRMVKAQGESIEEIKLSDWLDPAFYEQHPAFLVSDWTPLSDGNMAIVFDQQGNGGYVYDLNDGNCSGKFETTGLPIALEKEQYAQIQFHSSEQLYSANVYDYSGKELSSSSIHFDPNETYSICGGGGKVFLLSHGGITQLTDKETTVMDGSIYTYGGPVWEARDFKYSAQDNCFYLILNNMDTGEQALYRYTYDESLLTEAAQSLSIFTLQDSDTLRQAISSYQVKNPEQRIELQIGLSETLAATKDDVVRALNTELLAGKGPDVLILDGLPIETYIEKGVLKDIADLINSDGFFTNITNAYSDGEKLYAIPARYYIPVLAGEKGLLDSLKGLSQVAEKAQLKQGNHGLPNARDNALPEEERPLAYVNLMWDPVKLFFPSNQNTLLENNSTVNRQALSQFLDETKKLYQKCGTEDLAFLEEGDPLEEGIASFAPRDVYGQRTLLGIANARGFMDCFRWAWSAPTANGEKFVSPELYMVPLCGPDDHTFIPSIVVAVNGSSEQPDNAKKFIEILLSEDVQRPEYSEGFPVNKTAFQAAWNNSKDEFAVRYETDMEQLAASLTTPVTIDETILEAVLDEVKPYYKDEETLEEAVDNISAKLRTYLAEKS